MPRHRHKEAYAAIVLRGAYEECGNHGRFLVCPGDVLFHGMFDGHLDRFQPGGAQILNLRMAAPDFNVGTVADPDTIARLAETDSVAAKVMLLAQAQQKVLAQNDWPDLLAADLIADPGCKLEAWAVAHRMAPETLSRGFGRLFGVTPAAFRLEARVRQALVLIGKTAMPLSAVALRSGFADQAHMSRAVRALSGRSPLAWRRSNLFKIARPLWH